MKMYDQNSSIIMNDQTLQSSSSSSKPERARQKLARLRRHLPKRTNNVTISIRERVLSKVLTSSGDSLIHVPSHKHRLISEKNKNAKEHHIITINVSGNRYQTHLSTLETYPNTLLGNEHKRRHYWNNDENEYFFDRHRTCFEAILYYYQSNGRLRRPDYVPLDTFLEEVSFFDLGPHAITQINKLENVSIVKYIDLPNLLWRRYIWFYLEFPQHSLFAKILYSISMLLTVLSCVELAVETMPIYNDRWNNLCHTNNQTFSTNDIPLCSRIFTSPFFLIQTICVAYFTMEFILRVISTPSYYRFVFSIVNWIDLGAIVPYYVFLILALNHKATDVNGNSFIGLRIFRIFRFLRIFKIYLIFKQLKSLRVLSSTLKESFIDFVIMIVILTLMGFLFGAATYYAEQDTNGDVFDSIPKATYWGILTITTVGYGDMSPITVVGRILACSCAFFGVATSGMLVSVLVDRYQRVYNRKKFFPEQILSAAADSSDSEHDEKQDFINRKLSGTRKTLFSGMISSQVPTPPVVSPNNYRKYLDSNSSSSNIQFIITLNDDKTKDTSLEQIANELLEELTGIVKNSGEEIHLKLICPDTDPSNHRTLIAHELSAIKEE